MSHTPHQNYTHTIANNSFWNLINYITTGVAAVIISILLTRFLGVEQYGIYSFFMSTLAVGSLFLDFGFGQAIGKYVPRYFNDPENKGLSIQIFLRSLSVQAIASMFLAFILLITFRFWQPLIGVSYSDVQNLTFITLITLTPVVVSRQIINFLSSTQNFKIITIVSIATQLVNVALILLFTLLKKDLSFILSIQLIINLFSLFVLYFYLRPLLKYEKAPKKTIQLRDIFNFSTLAYINTILTFVVWSYSEVFFLGYYAPSAEVGFYTLAFSLSAIVSSIPGLYLKIAYNVQFELLEKGEEDRSDQISSTNVKLMSIIFLPLALYITYFSTTIIYLLYGSAYDKVSIILPLVLFGTIISTTLGSPLIKANNNNKVFATTILITGLGALVNLSLDYLLIPRFYSIGAGVATIISQLILTSTLLTYTFRVLKIRIDWLNIIKVYLANIGLGLILYGSTFVSQNSLFQIVTAVLTMYLYFKFLIYFSIFDAVDESIFKKLTGLLPVRAQEQITFLFSLGYKHPVTRNPTLYMTLLVKNEEDILEKNLLFHKDMGVDGFIVTDNNSTDNTNQILQKYKKMGWIKEIITEKTENYAQAIWVDRMIQIAKDSYDADWIINADADEFWYPYSGDLKTELMQTQSNVVKCQIFTVLPDDEAQFFSNTLMVKRKVNHKTHNLTPFNSFSVSIPKVIHRTKGYEMIHMGNHKVEMDKLKIRNSKNITIYHYNIRSKERFKQKMLTGGAAYARNTELSKDTGAHWRYFYEGHKDGSLDLDLEYDRFIGKKYWDEFLKKGILVKATKIKEYFTHE